MRDRPGSSQPIEEVEDDSDTDVPGLLSDTEGTPRAKGVYLQVVGAHPATDDLEHYLSRLVQGPHQLTWSPLALPLWHRTMRTRTRRYAGLIVKGIGPALADVGLCAGH